MIVRKFPGSSTHIYPIEHQNWVPADRVSARFDIQHDGSSIFLEYFVREEQVRAVNTAINSPVWEDSCVEFFLSPDGDENYFNFEFNAIGTVLGAYGRNREDRQWLPVKLLSSIETTPSLGRNVIKNLEEETSWTLKVKIPAPVVCHNLPAGLSGLAATANFYKCGDRLKKPHFLSWQPVYTGTPDFHTPQYFGKLVFE